MSVFTPGVREGGQVNEPTVHCWNPDRMLSPVNGLKALWADRYLSNPINCSLHSWKTIMCSAFVNILNHLSEGCFGVLVIWMQAVAKAGSQFRFLVIELDGEH